MKPSLKQSTPPPIRSDSTRTKSTAGFGVKSWIPSLYRGLSCLPAAALRFLSDDTIRQAPEDVARIWHTSTQMPISAEEGVDARPGPQGPSPPPLQPSPSLRDTVINTIFLTAPLPFFAASGLA
nr:unnamed protein product [Leishmania braziliensis]